MYVSQRCQHQKQAEVPNWVLPVLPSMLSTGVSAMLGSTHRSHHAEADDKGTS